MSCSLAHMLPMRRRLSRITGLALLSVLFAAGCTLPQAGDTSTQSAQAVRPIPPVNVQRPPERPEADSVTAHFRALEALRLSRGLLRTDPNPRDLPVTAANVADIFEQIALFDEYSFINGQVVSRPSPAPLRRWQAPVRIQTEFGASVPEERRRADQGFVQGYARRLSQITGHPISTVSTGGNFHVLVLSEAERRASGPLLQRLVPGIDPDTETLIANIPLSVSCLVLAFSRSGDNVYTDAIAIIRAELPDLSRRACYYEEIAQGLGLPNDSPRARPSLFNDSGEFAVLTELDANLLRILYDARLRPGIRAVQARPIIQRITTELLGGDS